MSNAPKKEAPHAPAAFINAIAEEGSKGEAVEWLQKTWNKFRQAERENADLRAKLEAAQRGAERWRYWRMFWPALCRMEVSRFARIDLTRKYVQSPADMDEVTDAAMQEGK